GLWALVDRHLVTTSVESAEQTIDEQTATWLRDNRIALVLPVQNQGLTHGMLCFGAKQTREHYSDADVDFLSALANLFIVSLQNSFLVDEQIEKERLEEEMRLARQIQEKLQPSE